MSLPSDVEKGLTMEKHVILYSTHCPACMAMERLLKTHGYTFTINSDTQLMLQKGFKSVPWIEFEDGKLMNLKQAQEFFRAQH